MSKIALYLRLSVEEKSGKAESESITSQRHYLHNFLKSQSDLTGLSVEEYTDDGFSGTNTKRPAFQRLLEDIKNGKIKTIVVKDLSRFMRNYIEIGDYLENIFPFLGIRFIAINDGYDSKTENGNGTKIDIQFKNLLYDFYTKDASVKIKSVANALKNEGKFLAWSPPFGYVRDPDDRHKIIIDEEVAFIVREAFSLALDGDSTRTIARKFNEKGYITASERKKQTTNMDYSYNIIVSENHKKSIWMHGTIIDMLANENYTGTYCFNMVERTIVGGSKTKSIHKDNWGRVYDSHEPIVSIEDFNRLREIMAKKAFKNIDYKKKRGTKYSLQGSVFCEDCGHRMSYFNSKRKTKVAIVDNEYLQCRTCKIKGLKTKNVRLDKVEELCLKEIEERFVDAVEVIEAIKKPKVIPIAVQEERLLKEKDTAFMDYKQGRMTREEFLQVKRDIDERIGSLVVEDETKEDLTIKVDTAKLTKELVEKHIEKVVVSLDGTIKVELRN